MDTQSEELENWLKIKTHFTEQAAGCRQLGSAFTAALCDAIAADMETGGPTRDLLGDSPNNPRKDALSMRICGALHHATLSGAAPALASVYPAANPDWDMQTVWPIAATYLRENMEIARAFLVSAPQTNETARSIALLPGFLQLAARYDMPINLLELGASAGLNQNWDKFQYTTKSWDRAGESDVVISTDWRAPPPDHLDAKLDIASRAGCDLNPFDIHDPKEVLRLRSYVWADQTARLARFDSALALARNTGTHIEKADAADWLAQKLSARPDGQLTIVYHSIFLQYPPGDVIAEIMQRIRAAGDAATKNAPLAWLCFEPEVLFDAASPSHAMKTRLQTWPGGHAIFCGTADGHVTWFDA